MTEDAQSLRQIEAALEDALAEHPFGDAAVERILSQLPIEASLARHRGQVSAPPARRPLGLWGAAAAAAVLLAGGLVAYTQSTDLHHASPVDDVVATVGQGIFRVAEDGLPEAVAPGTPLLAGERVLAAETPATVELTDGTQVLLHADTEVALVREADRGVTVEFGGLDGEVFCKVNKRRAPFRVRARGLEVEVMGTQFLVHQGGRSSRVIVVEGSVLASRPGDRRRLGAGDAAESHAELTQLELMHVTPAEWIHWVDLPKPDVEPAVETPVGHPLPPVQTPEPPQQDPDATLDNPVVPPRTPDDGPPEKR
ncbi:MAG: FecR family protein [Planctomycetota bacterium]